MGAVGVDDDDEAMGAAVIEVRLEMVSALPFDFRLQVSMTLPIPNIVII